MPGRTHDQSPFIDWATAGRALSGEARSGDKCAVCALEHGVLLAVVDGIGHGVEAALVAEQAAATLSVHREESVVALIQACHRVLHGTRGAAISIAALNVRDDTMTWLAIGNVEAHLVRADPMMVPAREAVVMRGGTLGHEMPAVRASVTKICPGDTLIFATDGIRPGFSEQSFEGRPTQEIADGILADHAKGTDDALVLVAQYIGRPR